MINLYIIFYKSSKFGYVYLQFFLSQKDFFSKGLNIIIYNNLIKIFQIIAKSN